MKNLTKQIYNKFDRQVWDHIYDLITIRIYYDIKDNTQQLIGHQTKFHLYYQIKEETNEKLN